MNKLAKEVTQKTEIEQGEQYPWAAERSTPYRTSYCTRITDIPDLTANCEKNECNEGHVFHNFAKAYDSIWRSGARRILKKYGIHAKLIRLIRNLYSTIAACIHLEGKETDWFKFETGFI